MIVPLYYGRLMKSELARGEMLRFFDINGDYATPVDAWTIPSYYQCQWTLFE